MGEGKGLGEVDKEEEGRWVKGRGEEVEEGRGVDKEEKEEGRGVDKKEEEDRGGR